MEEEELRRRAGRFAFGVFALAGTGAPLGGERRGRSDQRERQQRQDRDGGKTGDSS